VQCLTFQRRDGFDIFRCGARGARAGRCRHERKRFASSDVTLRKRVSRILVVRNQPDGTSD
jgi:hypothetical protein